MWEGWSVAPQQKGTIPIIGASRISQNEKSLAALGCTPTEKEMQLLNEVINMELGFPT
jgi:aryl-alcohol dehydrogenase-like predicted oxidoreductase